MPVGAEQNRLPLRGLVEGVWEKIGDGTNTARPDNPYHAFALIPFGEHAAFPDPLW